MKKFKEKIVSTLFTKDNREVIDASSTEFPQMWGQKCKCIGETTFDKLRPSDSDGPTVRKKCMGNVLFYYTRRKPLIAGFYVYYFLLTAVDMISDILYFAMSPFYSPLFAYLCVFFWLLPLLVSSLVFCWCRKASCHYRCATFWLFTLDHLRVNRHPNKRKENFGLTWSLNILFFVLLEDFFLFQVRFV